MGNRTTDVACNLQDARKIGVMSPIILNTAPALETATIATLRIIQARTGVARESSILYTSGFC